MPGCKEETDVSMLQARKGELIKRIEAMAEGRDIGNPQVVGDTQSSEYWYPMNGGWQNGG